MTSKTNLTFTLVILTVFAVLLPCLADEFYDTVIVKPDKIILTTEGTAENTIQVNIPMSVGTDISLFEATFTIDGTDFLAVDFEYCAIDDILHVFFDREDIVGYLLGEDVDLVEVTVTGSFNDGFMDIYFDGIDEVEVITPIEDTQYQNKEHKKE